MCTRDLRTRAHFGLFQLYRFSCQLSRYSRKGANVCLCKEYIFAAFCRVGLTLWFGASMRAAEKKGLDAVERVRNLRRARSRGPSARRFETSPLGNAATMDRVPQTMKMGRFFKFIWTSQFSER